jgi:hypothetical protein
MLTHTCRHTHTHTHTYTNEHTHTHTHAHTYAHTRARTYTCTHTRARAHTHAHTHSRAHTPNRNIDVNVNRQKKNAYLCDSTLCSVYIFIGHLRYTKIQFQMIYLRLNMYNTITLSYKIYIHNTYIYIYICPKAIMAIIQTR